MKKKRRSKPELLCHQTNENVLLKIRQRYQFICDCALQPKHVSAAHTTECACGMTITDLRQLHPECTHRSWYVENIENAARKQFGIEK